MKTDQPGHPPSLISLRCPHEETLGPLLPIERTAKTDQNRQMPRMMGVAGRTDYFVVLSCGGSEYDCYLSEFFIKMSQSRTKISKTRPV